MAPNLTRSMDFVMDALATGRRIKCLTCVDDFTKGMPDGPLICLRDFRRAGHAYSGQHCAVSRLSGYDKKRSGARVYLPRTRSVGFWHGVELRLISPASQRRTDLLRSFNGRFRDECLNEHWFSDIVHAGRSCDWRLDYNECRPHSSLNYLTPAEFAAGWRNGKYEEKPTDITN